MEYATSTLKLGPSSECLFWDAGYLWREKAGAGSGVGWGPILRNKIPNSFSVIHSGEVVSELGHYFGESGRNLFLFCC